MRGADLGPEKRDTWERAAARAGGEAAESGAGWAPRSELYLKDGYLHHLRLVQRQSANSYLLSVILPRQ